MATEKTKRTRGRPALPPDAGKRYPLAIRTTRELKERIERASRVSGRSVTQEIEHRLERTFEDDASLGGPETAIWFRTLAEEAAAAARGQPWLTSLTSYRRVTRHLENIMRARQPIATDGESEALLVEALRPQVQKLREANAEQLDYQQLVSMVRCLVYEPATPVDLRAEAEAVLAAKGE
jgi:hypothetical protein